MSWRETVLHVMRVPPQPAPPPGSPPRVFRAAPNYFRLRAAAWAITQVLALAGLVWAFYFIAWMARNEDVPRSAVWILRIGEAIAWAALLFRMFFGWMLLRLDYELRWYMVSDRAIRIREGISSVREKTIVLANVQNISVRQGPLQRFLGIADVEVRTAGGGAGGAEQKSVAEPMHVAYFRGVDNAAEIRDLLRDGVRMQRNAGLGDPDEEREERAAEDSTQTAAGDLLDAARALRVTAETL